MPARLLHRSATERKIAGVCGGIARQHDLDPALVRLAAIALAVLAPPLGLLGYAAAWIVIPLEPAANGSQQAGGGEQPAASIAQVGSTPAGRPSAGLDARQLESRAGLAGGLAIVLAGTFFLLINMGILEWEIFRLVRWRTLWPLALIALGGILVFHSLRSPHSGERRPGSA